MFNEQRRFSVVGADLKSVRTGNVRTPASVVSARQKEEAFIGGGGFFGSSGNTNMNVGVSGPMSNMSMLAGMVPQQEDALRKYYRDMYFYDAVGGSAADMLSTFPYSDFSLTGCDEKTIEKYHESMVRLNIRTLMPEATLAYLVDGSYCASLIFNQRDKVFIDIIAYPVDDCRVDALPFYSTDPVITVRASESLRRFLSTESRQAVALKALLPTSLLAAMGSPAFELDPLTALYIARRTLPGAEPMSWLKRMLPIYLLEKTLYRGTLIETMRRQRSMLHVAMGDDLHEYTPDEMSETVNQFQLADLDPLGAIVGTRNNVQVQEIRQGGDFWKWTDNIETLNPMKLRALGISEAFLSGDSCLVGDTLIPTDRGLVTLESLGTGRVRNDIQSLNTRVKSRFGVAKTKAWLYNGFRNTFKITTGLGNSIQATGNHPVLVMEAGETIWKRTDKLAEGDILCVSTDKLVRKNTLRLDVEPYSAPERALLNINGDGRGMCEGSRQHKYKDVVFPKKMDPKLAYWLALFISEGTTATPGKIGFGNTDKRLVNRFASLSEDLFSVEARRGKHVPLKEAQRIARACGSFVPQKQAYGAQILSVELVDWMSKIGVYTRVGRVNGLTPSYYKEVPWSVLQADEESQIAFLAGYAECDGCVGAGVSWFSKSERLIEQIQAILNSHGYAARRVSRKDGLNSVSLSRCEGQEFWKSAEKYLSEKRVNWKDLSWEKLNGVPAEHWLELIRSRFVKFDRHGSYYNDENGVEFLFNKSENPVGVKDTVRFNYEFFKNGQYAGLFKLLKRLSRTEHDKLITLLKLEYRFTEITSIAEGGSEHVYDISMADGVEPSFVANGIVVHNTYSNVETGMSVFMENTDALRNHMTYEVLTNKVFPIVAVSNDFFKKGKEVDTSTRKRMTYQVNNHHDLDIPTVRWHKRLEVKSEDNVMEVLEALSTKGFPIPLRMWAAAAKIDINSLYQDLEQDEQIKNRLSQITGTPPEEIGKPSETGDSDPSGQFASLRARTRLNHVPLLSRVFREDTGEVKGETKTGKAKYVHNQKRANDAANAAIAKSVRELSNPNVRKAALKRVVSRLGKIPKFI